MRTSKIRGHKIFYDGTEWRFCDTRKATSQAAFLSRPCNYCKKYSTKEGYDGCLGTLIGIMNVCCGHRRKKESYVQFLDGHSIHGKDAYKILKILKRINGGQNEKENT
jgi:hypothetical protein